MAQKPCVELWVGVRFCPRIVFGFRINGELQVRGVVAAQDRDHALGLAERHRGILRPMKHPHAAGANRGAMRGRRELLYGLVGLFLMGVGIRAVPVGEAMVACVLADAMLRQRALRRNL